MNKACPSNCEHSECAKLETRRRQETEYQALAYAQNPQAWPEYELVILKAACNKYGIKLLSTDKK